MKKLALLPLLLAFALVGCEPKGGVEDTYDTGTGVGTSENTNSMRRTPPSSTSTNNTATNSSPGANSPSQP